MASGRLASSQLTAGIGAAVYTCPAGKTATVNFSCVNGSESDGLLSVAITSSGTPVNGEFIEKDALILNGAGLERTGLVVGSGQSIYVLVSFSNSEINIWGFEE